MFNSIVELSDDTAPNAPLVTTPEGWQPPESIPVKINTTEIKINPSSQEKWSIVKEGPVTTPNTNETGIHKKQPPQDTDTKTDQTSEHNIKEKQKMNPQSEDSIKWETNTDNLTWETNPIDDIDQPKPLVTQGTASEIKLFLKKPNDQQNSQMKWTDFQALSGYPKGVPRTFLAKQQSIGAIQPQEEEPQPKWELNQPISSRVSQGPNQTTSRFDQMPVTSQATSRFDQMPVTSQATSRFDQMPVTSQATSRFDQMPVPSQAPSRFDQMPVSQGPNQSRFDQMPAHFASPAHVEQTKHAAQAKDFMQARPSRFDQPPAALQIQGGLPEERAEKRQQYSPTDTYDDGTKERKDSESSDGNGQKRLSAFRRLGPLSQPKKPKLTINLLCNKDVREVLDTEEEEEDERYTPVHLRRNMLDSCDETVLKFLPYWPWKRGMYIRKTVTARESKTVMMLEQEQMEEIYERDAFILVSVRGYPRKWTKEHVLDTILEHVKGKSFIPCFIEFTPDECKFLVIRSAQALVTIHKLGFYLRKDDVELCVTISQTDINLKQLEFIPRLVLRRQLAAGYDGEIKLSLREFTLKPDISHFIFFPLNRLTNQTELVQLQSTVAWDFLTDLDLSYNRITSIDGFELPRTTPKLKHLDLSHNCIEKVTSLLRNRDLSLKSIKLEGNPLCHDYTDPAHYVKVLKMIFPTLTEIDGVPIHLKGDLPKGQKNFCSPEAEQIASKFLEVFFPLLEQPPEGRARIEDMYDPNAVLTVTYRSSLRYSSLHRKFRNLFLRARVLAEGDEEAVEGAPAVARLLLKWPDLQHDPTTFTVDVMLHSENTTILRIGGVLKLTSETLAEDEHLVAFTRTVVLGTDDGIEYKIKNEMVYWDEPTLETAHWAFQVNRIRSSKRLSLELDSPPDEDLKTKLVEVFARITELDKKSSRRCLVKNEWNLRSAIEYFMKFIKIDDLDSLKRELQKIDEE